MIRYRGLTWNHPRGYAALTAAAGRLEASGADVTIEWERQPLEAFESHPVAELCRWYDLIVLDHPHLGEAVAASSLRPLEELFADGETRAWEAETIGRCFASYRYAGQTWALPLDAASQVMAVRPDLVPERPVSWDEVTALSARAPVTLSLAGPHALLTFFSIASALGGTAESAEPEQLVSPEAGAGALDLMATLHARMPGEASDLNPIQLLEAMASCDEVALCPLVYGYVTYAVPDGGRRQLTFLDAPRAGAGDQPGSTLGGTGLAISRACDVRPPLLDHLQWLMSRDAQVSFIPAHDGQPSRREAWHDAQVNARCGDFYRNTANTLEQAWVRPRHAGYITFQAAGSALIRRALDDRTPHRIVLERLQSEYAASRREARLQG